MQSFQKRFYCTIDGVKQSKNSISSKEEPYYRKVRKYRDVDSIFYGHERHLVEKIVKTIFIPTLHIKYLIVTTNISMGHTFTQ